MQFLTLFAAYLLYDTTPILSYSHTSYSEFLISSLALMGYFLGYTLIAGFIRRKILATYIDTRNNWVVSMLVCAIFSIGPIAFGSILGFNTDLLMIGSPLSLTMSKVRFEGTVFSALMVIIAVVFNLPWLISQFKEFLNYSAADNINDDVNKNE